MALGVLQTGPAKPDWAPGHTSSMSPQRRPGTGSKEAWTCHQPSAPWKVSPGARGTHGKRAGRARDRQRRLRRAPRPTAARPGVRCQAWPLSRSRVRLHCPQGSLESGSMRRLLSASSPLPGAGVTLEKAAPRVPWQGLTQHGTCVHVRVRVCMRELSGWFLQGVGQWPLSPGLPPRPASGTPWPFPDGCPKGQHRGSHTVVVPPPHLSQHPAPSDSRGRLLRTATPGC